MKEITSKDNRIFKEAMSLKEKKYRDKLGLYLIEGWNLLEEAIKCDAQIVNVFICPEVIEHMVETDENFVAPGVALDNVFELSSNLFKRLSDTETSQGIIAVVKKKEQPNQFNKQGS